MKKILIVGASSGIGLALAGRMKEQSAIVVSLSRHRPGVPVDEHIVYDVRSDDDPPSIEGALDGLVYCPGSINLKPFRLTRLQDYRDDLEINFLGAVKMVRHYLPALGQSGKASIVLFSSVAAAVGMPLHSSIAAAKGAVEAWVRALAAELAPLIRVNAIAPSLVPTPLSDRLTNSEAKVLVARERHPLKRIGSAAEIAGLAAFLLSDEAGWITGQIIRADGGIQAIRY